MADMTLQEAIDHAREVEDGCSECAKQHGQLANWLEELQEYKRVGATPADVRPVVLCDKCRWFSDRGYPNPDPEMPELRMGYCHILGRDVQACWFCATGEREGGDAE